MKELVNTNGTIQVKSIELKEGEEFINRSLNVLHREEGTSQRDNSLSNKKEKLEHLI